MPQPIKLGKTEYVTLVDDSDFEQLNQWKWFLNPNGYASRRGSINGIKQNIYIHRLLTNKTEGRVVDHIDRNKLNNCRSNLRVVTPSTNSRNRIFVNKYGMRGVTWYKPLKKWKAQITVNYKNYHLGYFDTKEDASMAYQNASKNHIKELELYE